MSAVLSWTVPSVARSPRKDNLMAKKQVPGILKPDKVAKGAVSAEKSMLKPKGQKK